MPEFVIPLPHQKDSALIGRKAASLAWLQQADFLIPTSVVCTTKLFESWKLQKSIPPRLIDELNACVDPNKTYAVRSSGNLEDTAEKSFAGQ